MPTTTARATEILMSEHEVILDVLDCLEHVADTAERRGALDARSAGDALDFLAAFADRCHHGKEEGALFPALHRKGLPREVGPVAVMLAEHDQGRAGIVGMRAALAEGDAGLAAFVAHARAYVRLLRDHIAKENGVLFPMADGMLSSADQRELLHAFDTVEHDDLGPGAHEKYLALAKELGERLEVRRPASRGEPRTGGCCGHVATCG